LVGWLVGLLGWLVGLLGWLVDGAARLVYSGVLLNCFCFRLFVVVGLVSWFACMLVVIAWPAELVGDGCLTWLLA
jgi:hypothetical protein